MTAVCAAWLVDNFLTAQGFTITARADGRRTATRDGLTYPLDGQCRHDPADCPPHQPTTRREQAA